MGTSQNEEVLTAAVAIENYYAFLAQVLRVVIKPEAGIGMTEDQFNEQLGKIRKVLEPILAKNAVVQKNIWEMDQNVMRIQEAAADKTSRKPALEEAIRYLPIIEERTRTVSDLVALFKPIR